MHAYFGDQHWVTPFGLMFVLAILSCWWLARRSAGGRGLDPSHIDLLLPLSLVAGLLGAALSSLLLPADRYVAGELMQSGMRIRVFWLLAAGSACVFVYSRIAALSFRALLDTFALPVVLALAIHRVGCFLAGCCFGDISVEYAELARVAGPELALQLQTLPWLAGDWVATGVRYPPGSLPYEQHVALGLIGADAATSLPVHPVPVYEAGLLLALFLLLCRIAPDRHPRGTIVAAALVGYAILRFGIEYLRADGALVIGRLSITQLQCIVVLLAGSAYWFFAVRRAGYRARAQRESR